MELLVSAVVLLLGLLAATLVVGGLDSAGAVVGDARVRRAHRELGRPLGDL